MPNANFLREGFCVAVEYRLNSLLWVRDWAGELVNLGTTSDALRGRSQAIKPQLCAAGFALGFTPPSYNLLHASYSVTPALKCKLIFK